MPLLVGALVSVTLGVYARAHHPTGDPIPTFGFSDVIHMKVWFTTVVALLALVQVATALRIFGHLASGKSPHWVHVLHRTRWWPPSSSGTTCLLVVWLRDVRNSCLGPFAARLLVLRRLRGQDSGAQDAADANWALPVLGGAVFASIVGLWLTSALCFFQEHGAGY